MALAYIIVMAGAILGLQVAGFGPASWQYNAALFGLNVLLVIGLFFVFDRGRIISPAYSRLDARQVAKLRALTAARVAASTRAEAPS
jgi:hypothetical protein